jgi:hypothetical protein
LSGFVRSICFNEKARGRCYDDCVSKKGASLKIPILVTMITLIFAMLACNYPGYAAETNTPSVYELPTNTQPAATGLPIPGPLSTNTPAIPVTGPTPSVPAVFANEFGVHCRFGPGTTWAAVSSVAEGDSSQIVGQNSDSSWWYILDPFNEGQRCWVAASVTTTGGNLASVPIVGAPQASVTEVSVDVNPKTIRPSSCADPASTITIAGSIETNGPATVDLRFETQQGGSLSDRTINFTSFGVQEFSAEYDPPSPLTAGTYWVRLVVTSPNDIQAEVTYTIECT